MNFGLSARTEMVVTLLIAFLLLLRQLIPTYRKVFAPRSGQPTTLQKIILASLSAIAVCILICVTFVAFHIPHIINVLYIAVCFFIIYVIALLRAQQIRDVAFGGGSPQQRFISSVILLLCLGAAVGLVLIIDHRPAGKFVMHGFIIAIILFALFAKRYAKPVSEEQ